MACACACVGMLACVGDIMVMGPATTWPLWFWEGNVSASGEECTRMGAPRCAKGECDDMEILWSSCMRGEGPPLEGACIAIGAEWDDSPGDMGMCDVGESDGSDGMDMCEGAFGDIDMACAIPAACEYPIGEAKFVVPRLRSVCSKCCRACSASSARRLYICVYVEKCHDTQIVGACVRVCVCVRARACEKERERERVCVCVCVCVLEV
jgi:hypothetical protein